ncbi:MAG: bifunctional D-glycero-beta-D-manno-heptose-7-phosphate kinase/D-glycero-beta-D-manno-heptose 1-phosphate adenylyltransferase HldE [Gammaproteobacteria bacterium]
MTLSVPTFDRATVLVAGDVMLDRYWFGPTARISPEAPVPVVRVDEVEERPGGAGNVAVNLATLGAGSRLLSVTGDDEAAARLRALLAAAGVSADLLAAAGAPTVTKLRVLSRNQQLLRLDFEQALAAGAADTLADAFAEAVAGVDAVVLSDYGKGCVASARRMIEVARAAGAPVLVDPKGADFERYRGATVITPNEAEFEAVAGPWRDDDDLARRAQQLRCHLELDYLLVTRSDRGMMLVGEDGPTWLPAEAREVFDVTGAGDTVIATAAAGLAAGLPMIEAASLANLAAGIVVGKLGVAAVTPAELTHALHTRGKGGRGLVGEDEAASLVAEARRRGETVVMTNGCFDILHAGHVAYLEEAKSLGDRLVVAVNDDASVSRLKGASRPLNPLEDRMAVLAGLAAVDWVVPFSEDTPARIIGRLLPAVLVKGGDYRPDQIAGGDAVKAAGGEVRVLPFREGRSTTRLIQRIRGG